MIYIVDFLTIAMQAIVLSKNLDPGVIGMFIVLVLTYVRVWLLRAEFEVK